MTWLAVPITARDVRTAHAEAARAAELGADIVEYRLDHMRSRTEEVAAIVGESPLGCIATCRPTWEGGGFDGPEDDRLAVLEAAANAGARYLDFELAAWARDAAGRNRIAAAVASDANEQGRPALILSSHDFAARPADLLRRVHAMAEEPRCRVVKIAWQARSLRDNLEAFELMGDRHKPTIAICMGEFGTPSRILAPRFGGLLTFASLDDGSTTAPGQLDVATMKSLYRWDAIGPATRVYGVIGWPVAHSMSPALHNLGFGEVGHDGVYLPMPIPPEYEHFKATLTAWIEDGRLGFAGASVTIPHKQNLLRLAAERGYEVEDLARSIGAANTLVIDGDAGRVLNTDYAAALGAVCETLGIEPRGLAGRRVGVLGAGGAAAAVIAGFAHHGASVVVINRTPQRAEALAERFHGMAGSVAVGSVDALGSCDVIVNCTPLGMHPKVEASPIDPWPDGIAESAIVFDTIYNPVETRLLREARRRGLRTISGVEMFVRQAAAQFEAWTAKTAPVERFRDTITRRLNP